MPFIIDARNMGGGSIGSAAGGDTSTGTRNNVTLAAPWDESKEYLKGDLATNNGDLYQAQKSVPAGVQISDEDYWALVVAGDKSKETEQLRKDIGSLGNLETESKDNLVDAINEVNRIQSDWNQNDETKKDYIKNRPFYEGTSVENLGTTFEGWRASCQSHGEDSMVINANVAGIDYQDVEGLVQTGTNGRYVYYYFGENRDYRIQVDRGMAQVTIRPVGTEYYFYKVSSTVKQIDPKYIPNQNTVFEARLFMDGSIPYRLNLESGIAVSDLVRAFDEGQRVIARLCPYEDGYGYPFEMQMYIPGSSRDIPNTIMFAPCSISSASIDGEIQGMSTVIIGFEDGDWYFSGFALDAIRGAAFETPYTVPFEVNAMYCETFDELVSATHDFRWRAYIYKGDHKLYLQVPEYSPSVTPSVLYFTGITEPDDTRMSRCVWTTIKIPVSSSNVILWDDSTLPISNTALDTWENYRLDKDQSGALYIYDVFNNKIDLGLVGAGVIEYQGYRYLFNNVDGASLRYYCMDFNRASEPKFSKITINRRINDITVTDFQPLWEIATESEVNNAVDNIFKTI